MSRGALLIAADGGGFVNWMRSTAVIAVRNGDCVIAAVRRPRVQDVKASPGAVSDRRQGWRA
jgi:hypothetical protein